MLVLIAESKTMTRCDRPVAPELSLPPFGREADEIMRLIADMPTEELADRVKLNSSMIVKLRLMAREFPYKATGCAALEAFTGVVFKAFSYPMLSPGQKDEARRQVRVISSLYGLLRPDDAVKPYRLDYTAPASPDGKPLCTYWKPRVTEALLRELDEGKHKSILNLLPADAAKCIDWKRIESRAEVLKAEFRAVNAGGLVRTPASTLLKTLRGKLLRQIVTDRVTTLEQLARIESDDYYADAVTGGTIVFITVS